MASRFVQLLIFIKAIFKYQLDEDQEAVEGERQEVLLQDLLQVCY